MSKTVKISVEIDVTTDVWGRMHAHVGRESVSYPGRPRAAESSQLRDLRILAAEAVETAMRDAWAPPYVCRDLDGAMYVVAAVGLDSVQVSRYRGTECMHYGTDRREAYEHQPWRYVVDVLGTSTAIGALCEALHYFGRGEHARHCGRCKYSCRVVVEADGAWTCPNPGCRHRHERPCIEAAVTCESCAGQHEGKLARSCGTHGCECYCNR